VNFTGVLEINMETHTHLLTKAQYLSFLLLVISLFAFLYTKQKFLFFVFIFLLVSFSVITAYLGWIMVRLKETVFYPLQSFMIRLAYRTQGTEAAEKLISTYTGPVYMRIFGTVNLIGGVSCFVLAGVLTIIVVFGIE